MKAKLNQPIVQKFLISALVLFFLSPIFIILFYFKVNFDLSSADFIFAFKNSAIQSLTAAAVCVLAAVAIVPGLAEVQNRWIRHTMNAALLPSMLPSLFTILIVFSFFRSFPFGHLGIVLIFFVTYFGMSTLILYNAYLALVNKYAHVIQIYNISILNRYLKVYLPELKKDILNVFLIIVLGCFSSLSVPLLAGGGHSVNVEMLIYESIYINGQWGTASLMAMIQMSIMFVLGLYLHKTSQFISLTPSTVTRNTKTNNLSFTLLCFYIGFYIFGYLYQVIKAFMTVKWSDLYFFDFLSALSHSFLLAGMAIVIFLVISTILFYLKFQKARSDFLMYFLLPSTTVVGLSLYLFFAESVMVVADIFKVALGLNLIYSLALYKSYVYPQISNIQSQLDVAKIYGISFKDSLKYIMIPQLKKSLFICISILVIFSFCEFALVKAAGAQTLFAGVYIERLITSYHLDHGFIYSFVVLVLVFSFFNITRFIRVDD